MTTITKRIALEYGVGQMADNICLTWSAMPDEYRAIGATWYPDNSAWVGSVARIWDVDRIRLSYAVAALSPSISWAANQDAAVYLAETYHLSGYHAAHSLRGTLAWQSNIEKAADILDGRLVSWSRALKTFNFGGNLSYPNSSLFVTIDRHSGKVCMADWTPGQLRISPAAYPLFVKAHLVAAERLGISIPSIVQAGTWQYHVDYTK